MDDCAERVQTSSFLSATVFSRRESNSHRRSRHHTCLAWRCELALMLPHYFADAILPKRCHLQYDTIRDAILTCARKPTWIGLIYRTETTTKNCKTEKLKSKSRYVRSNSKSLGNHVVRSEKKKKRGCSGKDLQKKVLSLEWKREWVMKNSLIVFVSSITSNWNCSNKA